MNFLAHALLAGADPEVIAGSVAGDFVKGVIKEGDYSAPFERGVRLHRRVDAFSNRNADLRASAQRVPAELQRIAPPCIDIMADHFLAQAASEEPQRYLPQIQGQPDNNPTLEHYEAALHEFLPTYLPPLGTDAARFFEHARTTQLFSDYRTETRCARGIRYVCERLARAHDADAMIDALFSQRDRLREDFTGYWPQLEQEAARFLSAAKT